MFIKKLYNDLDTIVDETLQGVRLITQDSYSEMLPGTRISVRRPEYRKPKGYVRVVSGGGAGHEGPPYVSCRPGNNDAYAMGDIFAAPSANQFLRAIQEVADGSPVIMPIWNHAGDVLNAKLCIQMAKALGIEVHMALVYNDVASAPKGHDLERRAIGEGCYDLIGIMAECGEPVEEILRVNDKVNRFTRTYGVGIRSAIHPLTGLPIMPMPDDEIELGIGEHGESSGNRIKLPRSRELARLVCDKILDDMPFERGEEVTINLAGLGGMTWTELDIFYKDVYEYLMGDKGLKLYKGSVANSGTQELGGIILALGKVDEEIKKWDNMPLPERCGKK
mgnify:CR=1 FL=1